MANSEIIGAGQDTARRAPKKYQIIYADPPWNYTTFSSGHGGRQTNQHYKTMRMVDIYDMPVKKISEDNAFLFLWAVPSLLPEALHTMSCWGFDYKTIAFTWVKLNTKSGTPFFGMGQWTRTNSEICLIGLRGKPERKSAAVSQVIMSAIEEHSKKPDEARKRIVELCGDIPRIELFARQRVEGWDAWGNEIEESPVLGEESPAQNTAEICHTAPNSAMLRGLKPHAGNTGTSA